MIANEITTRTGRRRAVCQHCDRKSRPVFTDHERLSIFDMPLGWSVAPYPVDFTHEDSSTGSLWSCPACNKRERLGEPLAPYATRQVRRQWAARVRELATTRTEVAS